LSARTTPAGFSADAFAEAADWYLRYRLPYPAPLLDEIVSRAGLHEGAGRLLDLGCGPGRLALALAPRFAEVWALDFEPRMVAAGRAEAGRRGARNVRWLVGAAEALEAPAGAFELITAGEAFHRFDQTLMAARMLTWLAPGGAAAIVGAYGAIVGDAPWELAAQEVVRRFTYRPSPDGPGAFTFEHEEGLLRAAGFTEVVTRGFATAHDWSIEAILGHLYSTSYCSTAVLGERRAAFERAMTAALLACDPAGLFRQDARFGFTIGRKPIGAVARTE